jgi:uncharacterized membrane protein
MMWGGGGWWVIGALVMVICIVMMVRMMGHGGSVHGDHSGADHHESTNSASEILAARFARGEISEEEFEQRKRVLEGSSH